MEINRQSSSFLSGVTRPGKTTTRTVSTIGVHMLIQMRFEKVALNERSPTTKLKAQIVTSHIVDPCATLVAWEARRASPLRQVSAAQRPRVHRREARRPPEFPADQAQ